MEMESAGLFTLVDQEIELQLASQVIAKSDDVFTLKNQYRRVKLLQTYSNEEEKEVLEIDTHKELVQSLSPIEKYYYRLIEHDFETQINSKGEEFYSGLKALNEKIQGDEFGSIFQTLFKFSPSYPNYFIEVGDTWHTEVAIQEHEVSITGNEKYLLKDWNDSIAYVGYESHLESRNITFVQNDRYQVNKTGSFIVDRKTGMVLKAEVEQELMIEDSAMEVKKLIGNLKVKVQYFSKD